MNARCNTSNGIKTEKSGVLQARHRNRPGRGAEDDGSICAIKEHGMKRSSGKQSVLRVRGFLDVVAQKYDLRIRQAGAGNRDIMQQRD